MKKIIIHLCLAVGLGTAFTGCSDFLDSDYLFDKKISIEKVFADKNYTNEWLAYAYEFLNNNEMQQVCSMGILIIRVGVVVHIRKQEIKLT